MVAVLILNGKRYDNTLTEQRPRLQLTVEVVEEHGCGQEANARRQRLGQRAEGQSGLEPNNLRPVAADELFSFHRSAGSAPVIIMDAAGHKRL